jgi:probable addiction module antidote protein
MNTLKALKGADLRVWLQSPDNAAEYLNRSINSGDRMSFLLALRDLALARGGISAVAEQSSLSRSSLYKTLSSQGNPELKSITSLLDSLGLKLSVTPVNRTL